MSSGSATRIICDKHNMNLIACGCGKDWTCDSCGEKFASLELLNNHWIGLTSPHLKSGKALADEDRLFYQQAADKIDAAAAKYAMSGAVFYAVPTLPAILAQSGSFRRMVEKYWRGEFECAAESIIEDHIPKETLCAYKPCK